MRQILLTIALSGVFNGFLLAVEPAGFSFSEKLVYSFKYNATSNVPLNNYFVKEIARFNYLNLYKTNYQLEYQCQVYLQKTGESQVSVNCQINPLQMKGDIFYEQFNLSDVMIPSVCDFVIGVYDNRHHKTATIEVTDCWLSQSPEKTFSVSGFIPDDNPGFELTEVGFRYLPDNKTTFEQRISAINNYLACVEVAKYAITKPLDINPDTRENTLNAFLKIYDLQRLMEFLNQQNHNTIFTIPPQYSQLYSSNLTYLDSQLRRLNTVFLQNMDTLSVSLNSEDYLEASTQIIAIQKGYLEALTRTNYLYEPVFTQMAHYFPSRTGWNLLITTMKDIFSNEATTSKRFHAEEFGSLLIDSYIRETDSLIHHQNFTDAVLMLESAEIVCDAISDNDCGLSVFNRLSISKYGIYDSYIAVARSAITAGNLHLAYKYLMMARNYQQSNSHLIITSGQVNSDLEQLAWLFLQASRGKDYNHLTQENLECLEKAHEIYQLINVHDFDHFILRLLHKYANEKSY